MEEAAGSARRRASRRELLAVCVATVQPQMLEDAADDMRVFDAGDDLHRAATVLAGLDLDVCLRSPMLRTTAMLWSLQKGRPRGGKCGRPQVSSPATGAKCSTTGRAAKNGPT